MSQPALWYRWRSYFGRTLYGPRLLRVGGAVSRDFQRRAARAVAAARRAS